MLTYRLFPILSMTLHITPAMPVLPVHIVNARPLVRVAPAVRARLARFVVFLILLCLLGVFIKLVLASIVADVVCSVCSGQRAQ